MGRPGLNFKSDFPILAGQDMFSSGWGGTALSSLKTAPPFCFYSSWELLSPSVTAKKHPGKPKSPSTSGLPVPATHTWNPKWVRISGKEGANQVSHRISLRAGAPGKDPLQLCLFGNIGMWPQLTLHYLTANCFLPSSINVRMTCLSSWAEDRWIHQRMLISLQVWLRGLSLFSQERDFSFRDSSSVSSTQVGFLFPKPM